MEEYLYSATGSALARLTADHMRANEGPTQLLGISLDHVDTNYAVASFILNESMMNGHGSAHGGMLFLLADNAFAYACNSRNIMTVAQSASITFVAPGRLGEQVTAEARLSAESGRTGVYDVRVTGEDGRILAIFQGISRSLGQPVVDVQALQTKA